MNFLDKSNLSGKDCKSLTYNALKHHQQKVSYGMPKAILSRCDSSPITAQKLRNEQTFLK
ncbi:hypothetical protein HMPREF3226_01395 [Prevotella corporis]|uniref:Uncharacterized protein n=1 Tax=Prevotella corporis TaxID=28128 RepID=A0A133Q9M1_9BACT|nr:hypothetical protein HMPREF3226_01395 [Prevotella corporis]